MNNYEIFRAVKTKTNFKNFVEYKKTVRPPGNVPYIVDNLWEWKRPDEHPNRRYSAYASPKKELAIKLAGEGTIAYRVKLKGKYKLGQLKGLDDSKKHPDCTTLKKFLLDKIGQEWIDNEVCEKVEIGKLFIPCLTKKEVDELFNTVEVLKKIRQEIYKSITYWDDVVLIQRGNSLPDPTGEVLFEAFDGYELEEI